MKTLTPAYGRDYRNGKEAEAAYQSGNDFILNDVTSPWNGKPCSCRDFPGEQVMLRFAELRHVKVVCHFKSNKDA